MKYSFTVRHLCQNWFISLAEILDKKAYWLDYGWVLSVLVILVLAVRKRAGTASLWKKSYVVTWDTNWKDNDLRYMPYGGGNLWVPFFQNSKIQSLCFLLAHQLKMGGRKFNLWLKALAG